MPSSDELEISLLSYVGPETANLADPTLPKSYAEAQAASAPDGQLPPPRWNLTDTRSLPRGASLQPRSAQHFSPDTPTFNKSRPATPERAATEAMQPKRSMSDCECDGYLPLHIACS